MALVGDAVVLAASPGEHELVVEPAEGERPKRLREQKYFNLLNLPVSAVELVLVVAFVEVVGFADMVESAFVVGLV